MTTTLDNVKSFLQAAEEQYQQLVQQAVMDDHTAKPETVLHVLTTTKRTLADFQSDIDRGTKRKNAARDIRLAETMLKTVGDLIEKRTGLEYVFGQAKTQAAEMIAEAAAPLRSINEEIDALRADAISKRKNAERVLRETADPSAENKLEPLRQRRSELLHLIGTVHFHRPVETVQAEIKAAETKLLYLEEKMAEPEADACRRRIERLEKELTESRKRAKTCEPIKVELFEIETRITELENEKLKI